MKFGGILGNSNAQIMQILRAMSLGEITRYESEVRHQYNSAVKRLGKAKRRRAQAEPNAGAQGAVQAESKLKLRRKGYHNRAAKLARLHQLILLVRSETLQQRPKPPGESAEAPSSDEISRNQVNTVEKDDIYQKVLADLQRIVAVSQQKPRPLESLPPAKSAGTPPKGNLSLNRLSRIDKEELYPQILSDLQDLHDTGKYTWPECYAWMAAKSSGKYSKYLRGHSLTAGQIKGLHTKRTKFTRK